MYRITTSGTATGSESVTNVPSIRTVPHWIANQPIMQTTLRPRPRQCLGIQEEELLQLLRRRVRHEQPEPPYLQPSRDNLD